MALRSIAGGVPVSLVNGSLTVPISGGLGYLPVGLFSNTSNISTSGTSASSIIPATGIGSLSIPANFFTPGKIVTLTISGQIVTQATPGTLSYSITLGASTIVTSGANTPTAGITAGFQLDAIMTCISTGTSGTLNAVTRLSYGNAGTGTALLAWVPTSNVTVNTTVANSIAAATTNSVAGGTVFNVYECQMEAKF